MPDATTIWLFREALAQAGLIDKLFERFGRYLEAAGYIARAAARSLTPRLNDWSVCYEKRVRTCTWRCWSEKVADKPGFFA